MDLTTMTDEALSSLRANILREQGRRATIATAPAQVEEMVATYQAAAGIHQTDGDEWAPVTSYLDAYPLGIEVTHGGKTWRSLRNGASGEPGVATGDWQEVQTGPDPVDWVQPHAGAEYPVGAIVRHNGRLWRNDHTAPNGWAPGTNGSGWMDITE